MKKLILIQSIVLSIISISYLTSCEEKAEIPVAQYQTPSRAEVIEAWQSQKFSMFIHFGIYSIPAGVWRGEQITGYSEQIKGHARIPTQEYRELAKEFNPVNWNPDSIALLAKRAGMRSIVITSKHHDGFSLFDTQFSTFDVVDATPYKRDIIKDLSDACRCHGLKFGVYFSLIDWDYAGALPFTSTRNSDSIPPLHHQYNLNQVEELLTNYGEISELWFDMGAPTYEQSQEIADLVKHLQPNCLVSGRIWNDQGDFMVMGDNYTPDFKLGVPWQTPASMFDETWSYRSWQERTDVKEKIKEKTRDLLNIVSADGNYLLNIGPMADGAIVPYEKQVLEGVGEWLAQNSEAIYGTTSTIIQRPDWGFITAKPGKLYLHVVEPPESNMLVLSGVEAKSFKASMLGDSSIALTTKQENGDMLVMLPEGLKVDDNSPVIVLDYIGDLVCTPVNTLDIAENQTITLTADNGEKYHSYSGQDYYSTKPTVIKLQWYVKSEEAQDFNVKVNYSMLNPEDELIVNLNNESYHIVYQLDMYINSYDFQLQKGLNEISVQSSGERFHRGLDFEGLRLVLESR